MGSLHKAIVLFTVCLFLPSLCVVRSAHKSYRQLLTKEKIKQILEQYHELRQYMEMQSHYLRSPLPSHCGTAVNQSLSQQSGVYHLRLPLTEPFQAYCLLDPLHNGSAWTIIQRREDGSMEFNRNWTDYKHGFGNLEGEYFIGLEKLHEMTKTRKHELWVELEDFEGESRHAKYNSFAIGDEKLGYALNVLGAYDGNAGDALRYHKYQIFSTPDIDNDQCDGSCAETFTGAWWFNDCFDCNLNGQYLHGKLSKDMEAQGIHWNRWHPKGTYSLKYAHMAVRRIDSI